MRFDLSFFAYISQIMDTPESFIALLFHQIISTVIFTEGT